MSNERTMNRTRQSVLDETGRTELVLALLGGDTTVAEAAQEHGLDPAELECWKRLYLDGVRHAARAARPSWLRRVGRTARRRPIAVTGGALAALAVLLVPVAALSETPTNCTNATSPDLCVFIAGEPAVAAEVNSNFTKLLGWLEAKVGGVDEPDIITTGEVDAGLVSATTVNADAIDGTAVSVGDGGLTVNGPLTMGDGNALVWMGAVDMGTATGMNPLVDTEIPAAEWNCFVGGLQMLSGIILANGTNSGNPLFAYTFVTTNGAGEQTWHVRADLRSDADPENHVLGLVCVRASVSTRGEWFTPHN